MQSHHKHLILLLLSILFMDTGRLLAQDKSLFEKRVFVNQKGDSLLYRILYPEHYDPGKKYPLVLFLHGAGERGNDNEKQLTHGADLFLTPENRAQFPAIVVFPQCPMDKYWIDISIRKELFGNGDPDFSQSVEKPSEQLDLVNQLTEKLIKEAPIDKKRCYVMGLSMGGFGTFETLGRWPKKYAAAIAICGGGNLSLVPKYAHHTSLWITHGGLDDIVPPELSKRVFDKLKAEGADVKYNLYPEANHNAWDPTFAEPDLLPWLFSKHK
ncbi:prolyl oligopeptidase family serine peptidase [Echinicola vietnamensis]|uniref:Putative peptidase n=1 Tax=Echinicola vietnamensis (strain DSM 17526 / LMG 23754 / KMM 6221) TaxID=926556 RepID=L0FZK4_ECHVK|nr:prolyl oligopeptidase family serine peptidase [Echinicola vietnamensis]AGA78737.1 putative peptidase [Echinicola vietnamensis DSM 17526]